MHIRSDLVMLCDILCTLLNSTAKMRTKVVQSESALRPSWLGIAKGQFQTIWENVVLAQHLKSLLSQDRGAMDTGLVIRFPQSPQHATNWPSKCVPIPVFRNCIKADLRGSGPPSEGQIAGTGRTIAEKCNALLAQFLSVDQWTWTCTQEAFEMRWRSEGPRFLSFLFLFIDAKFPPLDWNKRPSTAKAVSRIEFWEESVWPCLHLLDASRQARPGNHDETCWGWQGFQTLCQDNSRNTSSWNVFGK